MKKTISLILYCIAGIFSVPFLVVFFPSIITWKLSTWAFGENERPVITTLLIVGVLAIWVYILAFLIEPIYKGLI